MVVLGSIKWVKEWDSDDKYEQNKGRDAETDTAKQNMTLNVENLNKSMQIESSDSYSRPPPTGTPEHVATCPHLSTNALARHGNDK